MSIITVVTFQPRFNLCQGCVVFNARPPLSFNRSLLVVHQAKKNFQAALIVDVDAKMLDVAALMDKALVVALSTVVVASVVKGWPRPHKLQAMQVIDLDQYKLNL